MVVPIFCGESPVLPVTAAPTSETGEIDVTEETKSRLSFRQYFDDYSGGRLRIQMTPERFGTVWREIVSGSEPKPRFYIMVVVSTLIAAFGLVADSTAVVIGAMLVAPLMTPIFGISLGLVRGNTRLLRRAITSEIAGVLAAVFMGYLVGTMLALVDPSVQPTSEMLARTQPNIFDLFVAVLAGFAGAYALVDEKLSPALPGVAIATAIVPPLANSGLCLAYGAYQGALGSFLLFTANFLSIHLVAATLFFRAGMGGNYGEETTSVIARRFGVSFVFFVIISVTFGLFLYNVIQKRMIYNNINAYLVEELAGYSTTGIDKLVVNGNKNTLSILAQIYSTARFNPQAVQRLEEGLEAKLNIPADLMIREIQTSDVTSAGSNNVMGTHSLDGFFINDAPNPRIRNLRIAEQAIREYLAELIGMDLLDIDLLRFPNKRAVLALVGGIRKPTLSEIAEIESQIRARTGHDDFILLVRYIEENLLGSEGPIRYAWRSLAPPSPEQKLVRDRCVDVIRRTFTGHEHLLMTHVNAVVETDKYVFLVEVDGPGVYTKAELRALKEKMSAVSDKPVEVHVWLNHNVVMTENGLISYSSLSDKRISEFNLDARERIKELLINAR